MALSEDEKNLLNQRGMEVVRLQMHYAGAGRGSVVPGLGNGMISRGDVEDWLTEQERKATSLQARTLWWAKAAFWGTVSVGVTGIIATVVIALFGALFGK